MDLKKGWFVSNPYKKQVEGVFLKVFHFRKMIDCAIRETQPNEFNVWTDSEEEIKKKMGGNPTIDNARKLFHEYKYNCLYHWNYLVDIDGVKYQVFDFCGLSFNDGIYVHFEWMDTRRVILNEDDPNDETTLRMKALWDFFYEKRREILKRINDGALLSHLREEDFAGRITDRDFELVVK